MAVALPQVSPIQRESVAGRHCHALWSKFVDNGTGVIWLKNSDRRPAGYSPERVGAVYRFTSICSTIFIAAVANDTSWVAGDYGKLGDISCDLAAHTNDSVIGDVNAIHNAHICT